jgi:hypothetical protein
LIVAVAVPAGWVMSRPSADDGPAVTTIGAAATPGRTAATTSTAPSTGAGSPVGSEPATRAATLPPATARVRPARLVIPGIDVDATVDPVGVQADGSMVVPRQARRVGWYSYGPAPGDPAGAAVVAGHVDTKGQGPGAMYRLRETGVGDTVQVVLSNGRTLTYRVVAKQTIVKKRLPLEQLFARDGAPRLVLITCGGPFIAALSSYQDNVVVVAEPQP